MIKHSSQKGGWRDGPARHAHQTRATFGRSSPRASCFCLNQNGACSLERAHLCFLATLTYALCACTGARPRRRRGSDSLAAPSRSRITKVHSTRKSLATLDSCEATCTSSFRRAACALKLLIGCTLRLVESWEARVVRVEVAFCSFPREMAVSQHSSRAPPSQRPRSC